TVNLCCAILLPPLFSIFPYSTLFRSFQLLNHPTSDSASARRLLDQQVVDKEKGVKFGIEDEVVLRLLLVVQVMFPYQVAQLAIRSEEHTSELQSRFDIVSRLLLEKKY